MTGPSLVAVSPAPERSADVDRAALILAPTGEADDERAYGRPELVAVTPTPPPPSVGAGQPQQDPSFVEALVRRDMPRAVAPGAGRRR